MKSIIDSDPRSPERFNWIKKIREVEPVILDPPEDLLKNAKLDNITSGLNEYSGVWEKKQARHLLSRTLFGFKKSELDYFSGISMNDAVDDIVTISPLPEPPVNDYEGYKSDVHDPHVGLGESWLNAPHGGSIESHRVVSLKSWLIKNIINQEATIHEKMVLFWSNLLVTKVWDVYMAKASYQYFKLIYENSLGNYKAFIKALTLDPSMLVFLNGTKNTKKAPDENYGRELQELFCIGKGPESNYSEQDVQEAARVLTGWRIDWQPYKEQGQFTSYFDASKHDTGNKRFSEFYNNKLIEGKYNNDGAKELDELLDMIFDNTETSKYICRRIYSFFVYNYISETTEQNIIEPLAEIFRNNNYEIEPVLKALFKSEHFYDAMNFGVLIKSPSDHLLGLWKILNMDEKQPKELLQEYEKHRSMLWRMAGIGMEMGDPPNVAGWTPYYQAPQYDKAWITTSTITKRAGASDSMLYWGFWISNSRKIKGDIIEFVKTLTAPSNPVLLVKESTLILLGLDISDEAKDELKSILLSGQQNDYYWTSAWNQYIADPLNSVQKSIVENRLKSLFQRIFQLGEFQLM